MIGNGNENDADQGETDFDPDEERQWKQDLEHLRLLSIFHYIVGGLTFVFGCFPIFHLGFGIAMVAGVFPDDGQAPPAALGWLFVGVAAFMILFMWALALAQVIAGRYLSAQRAYTYCLVVSAIECLFMPFGTVLGVFTIVVLLRSSVKKLFDIQVGR